jgi:DNA-directed RNA polymerase specialized sigma24 family protein
MTHDWGLTRPALDRLLEWLDDDPERAARQYEQTRRALIKFFESRGCHTPEEQADRTIDRVARRIGEGIVIRVDEPGAYFYGVARNVLQEYYRRRSGSLAPLLYVPDDSATRHRRFECMGRCLDGLPAESRAMMIEYCSVPKDEKNALRRMMAERMGISLNTLRIRVHRIRDQLERCVRGCVES